MLVEFIGCSGSGKTTLSRQVHAYIKRKALLVDDPMSIRFGHRISNRIYSETIKNLALEATAIPSILSSHSSKHQQLWSLLYPLIKNNSVSHWERLRLFRSVFRKLGTYQHIATLQYRNRCVLVDEGTIHLAHVIFGRMKIPVESPEFSSFLELVPLPNLLVWVKSPLSMIKSRLSKRGELPIPDRTAMNRTDFLRKSEKIFQSTVSHLNGKVRILVANNTCHDTASLGQITESLATQILSYHNEGVSTCSN